MTRSGLARPLHRVGAGAAALLAAALLAPAATAADPVRPPTDCTSTPTFDHTTPMPPNISVSPLDDQGHVAVAAIGEDWATRVFTADHSSPPPDPREPVTLPVSALTCLGGKAWQSPAIVGNGSHLQVFVVGLDERIYYRERRLTDAWSPWVPVTAAPTPAAYVQAVMTGGRTDLFYVGAGQATPPAAVVHLSLSNGRWSPAESLGGNVFGALSVTRGADNKFHVWAVGGDSRIYVKVGNTGSWSGWRRMTTTTVNPSLSATVGFEPTKQREDVFITSRKDGEMYHGTFTNLGSFSGWEKPQMLGADINGAVSAASAGPGRLVVYTTHGGRGALIMYYGGAWHAFPFGAPYLDDQCVPRRPEGSDPTSFCSGLVENADLTPTRSNPRVPLPRLTR